MPGQAPPPSVAAANPTPEELSASAARWQLAMLDGDFEAAWLETDRWEIPRRLAERTSSFTRAQHHLTWNGAPFKSQRVLIRCEHGLGDAIQFVRYCPSIREQACCVIVKAPPALLDLFAKMDGIDLLLNAWTADPDPPHDIAIECMELAYAARHTPETLPSAVPYLPVSHIRATAGPIPIPNTSDFKLGLVWAASDWNPSRSIPLQLLAPLASLPMQLFSLQQGKEQIQLAESTFPVTALSPYTARIIDAAAAMLRMDAIVTVDSMTAHLAGALGIPVYLLLTHQADWRWMHSRTDSPWYPTMHILRQPTLGDWLPVVATLRDLLWRQQQRAAY